MKKTTALFFLSFLLIGCGNQPAQQTANRNTQPAQAANTNSAGAQRSSESLTVSSHSSEKSSVPSATAGNTTSSGSTSSSSNSPMSRGVDVTEMSAAIEKAEKAYKTKPDDAKLKDELAEAYFKRAFALTDAAQYRAALGDFRKGLKLKPEAQEAKAMHDQIVDIFRSIGREPPKEGEEPPPMPIEKKP
jgi:hypothetical protein